MPPRHDFHERLSGADLFCTLTNTVVGVGGSLFGHMGWGHVAGGLPAAAGAVVWIWPRYLAARSTQRTQIGGEAYDVAFVRS